MRFDRLRIAVLIPCYNEGLTIADVISGFQQALPSAQIYVYDNNSTDDTVERARQAGAILRVEPWQGKGNVVRRMFADIEADVYLLVDGDSTYPAAKAPELVEKLLDTNVDMVVGVRYATQDAAYRKGHQFGNRVFNRIVALSFGMGLSDIFSGYRAFSRRFVKSFPALSSGFEIETEMSVHALEQRIPFAEIALPYGARPEGSTSKLNTYRDGLRILWVIMNLLRNTRPLIFFGSIACMLAIVSLCLGYPLLTEFLETGLVPRFPTGILATGIMLVAVVSLACGFILDSMCRMRRELSRLRYLNFPSVSESGRH